MKKIILWLTLICTSWLFFSWQVLASTTNSATNQTVAQKKSKAKADEKQLSKDLKMYQNLWQGLYAITWPLLVIAWNAMTNDFVYGSFIWMDVLLWKIWNVMRTFANYIIWLVLIFSIFTLFLGWKFEQFNPMKVIPQLVISALLVNASWFILWVCLDVSTIATYSIWALPLKIWVDNTDLGKKPIPVFAIRFQNWKDKAVKVWIKDGKNILPFCNLTSLTWWNWVKVIIKNKQACAYEYNNNYYKFNNTTEILSGSSLTWKAKKIKTQTFADIRKKNPWMTAVLWTLYASILDLGKNVHSPSGSSAAMAWDLMFKTFFLIALIIPLLTFAIILIARVVVLWMFIIISPIVFLFTSIKWFGWKLLWEKWNLKSLCCMVFLPVPVVFALSLSFVFMNAINFTSLKAQFWIKAEWQTVVLQTDGNKQHDIRIKFKDTWSDSAWTNMFAFLPNTFLWIIKLVFAIWFMWILVFTALKSCKITWGIADSVSRFSVSLAKATPILPMAGWQSIASLSQWLWQLESLPGKKQSEQFSKLNDILQKFEDKITWKEVRDIEEVSKTAQTYNKTVKNIDISKTLGNKVNIGTKQSPNEKSISSLTYADVTNNAKLLTDISNMFKVSKETFQYYASNKTKLNNKISKSGIEAMWKLEKAKKIIKDTIDRKLTLNDLENDAKQAIVDGLWVSLDDIKNASQKLIDKLKELWFEDKDIKNIVKKKES